MFSIGLSSKFRLYIYDKAHNMFKATLFRQIPKPRPETTQIERFGTNLWTPAYINRSKSNFVGI